MSFIIWTTKPIVTTTFTLKSCILTQHIGNKNVFEKLKNQFLFCQKQLKTIIDVEEKALTTLTKVWNNKPCRLQNIPDMYAFYII